jgi:hypothetical protein
MTVHLAHLRHQGIDFAVFDADARSHSSSAREELLSSLVLSARAQGLNIDKAALAFREAGRLVFWGTPDLVRFLAKAGAPRWTHTIDI